MEPEIHIAGLLVQTLPESRNKVKRALAGLRQVEVHADHRNGKLVAVCECDSEDMLMTLIGRIRDLPGVLNVALVYQHAESAEAMDEVIDNEADTPRVH